jgi:hypothetical protein
LTSLACHRLYSYSILNPQSSFFFLLSSFFSSTAHLPFLFLTVSLIHLHPFFILALPLSTFSPSSSLLLAYYFTTSFYIPSFSFLLFFNDFYFCHSLPFFGRSYPLLVAPIMMYSTAVHSIEYILIIYLYLASIFKIKNFYESFCQNLFFIFYLEVRVFLNKSCQLLGISDPD